MHCVLRTDNENTVQGVEKMRALIVDSNERGPLVDAVTRRAGSKKPPISVHREQLLVGDYKCGEWLIEAKTLSDFFESLRSGHLMRQLDNMDANADMFGLLVWGDMATYIRQAKSRGSSITFNQATKQLSGALGRIAADFGCLIYRGPSIMEAAHFLVALHEKTYKKASRHGAQSVKRVSTNDLRVDMLRIIPGVGDEMVDNILLACGSLQEAACGECLQQVPRMGKVLRNRVIEALTHEDPVVYERKKKVN